MTKPMSAISSNSAARHDAESAILLARIVVSRRMATPILLFLTSHRPLAFVAGQLLHTLEPLAALIEIEHCGSLASLLSSPQGVQTLEEALEATLDQTRSPAQNSPVGDDNDAGAHAHTQLTT